METKKKWKAALVTAAGLAGIILGQTSLVRAGVASNGPVKITGSGADLTASGVLFDTRIGGDPADIIGCQYYSATNTYECFATKGGSVSPGSVYCTHWAATAGVIQSVTQLSRASAVTFRAVNGSCQWVHIYNQSAHL